MKIIRRKAPGVRLPIGEFCVKLDEESFGKGPGPQELFGKAPGPQKLKKHWKIGEIFGNPKNLTIIGSIINSKEPCFF